MKIEKGFWTESSAGMDHSHQPCNLTGPGYSDFEFSYKEKVTAREELFSAIDLG